ncbi:MAG: phospho-sugar mutase [Pseudonocardia sp.]
MTLRPAVRDAAMRWIADDPDPATRTELQKVLAAAMAGDATAADDVATRMAAPLRFGTAGLRGPVRAGPAGMNVAVVRRTTAGLAAWLAGRLGAPVGAPSVLGGGGSVRPGPLVVVGRDARRGSEAFAAAAAAVLAGAGFDTAVLPGPLPTPVLAFAVQHLGAAAGVQVTASHNPPADNGYKVYLGAAVAPEAPGAQLVGPADVQIEAMIDAAPPAVDVPTAPGARTVDVTEEYLDRVGRLGRGGELRIALTPLHGVGGETAVHALRRAGFTDVHVVASQAAPDPGFPTVAFPNPEERGATDALLALAAEVDADLAIALDPDADRCALGIPSADGWRMLTGDETGVLLGDHLLRSRTGLVATTVVSSSMLRAVAEAHGARYAETLTGFKHIVRAGEGLVFGYEEALGYCVDPDVVRDKDGIAAAMLACDLAAGLRAAGATLPDRLDELARVHGVHLTEGFSVWLDPPARDATVARLAAAPPDGWSVQRPAPDIVVLRRPGERLVVRPSGTEPKLKAYLEVVEPPADDVAAARARAVGRLAELRTTAEALLAP